MKILDRVNEIQDEVDDLIQEARELSRRFELGYRNVDDQVPDNVVMLPAPKRLQ